MPALRKLHGVPTALGSSATNGTGIGLRSPNTRTPIDVARTNATVSRILCARVASSSGGSGPGWTSGSMCSRTVVSGSFWADVFARK
jgi:hypothetical protein